MKRLVLVAVCACSGGSAGTDAPSSADAPPGPPQCAVAPGRAFTMSQIGFQPPGVGFDLDGDGHIDNALGFLAPIANQILISDVASGFSRYLFDVERWDGAPADDSDVTMVVFSGVDAD